MLVSVFFPAMLLRSRQRRLSLESYIYNSDHSSFASSIGTGSNNLLMNAVEIVNTRSSSFCSTAKRKGIVFLKTESFCVIFSCGDDDAHPARQSAAMRHAANNLFMLIPCLI